MAETALKEFISRNHVCLQLIVVMSLKTAFQVLPIHSSVAMWWKRPGTDSCEQLKDTRLWRGEKLQKRKGQTEIMLEPWKGPRCALSRNRARGGATLVGRGANEADTFARMTSAPSPGWPCDLPKGAQTAFTYLYKPDNWIAYRTNKAGPRYTTSVIWRVSSKMSRRLIIGFTGSTHNIFLVLRV